MGLEVWGKGEHYKPDATNLKKLTIYYFSFGLYRAPRLVRRLQPQHLREREDRRQLHRGDCARRHEAARRAPG